MFQNLYVHRFTTWSWSFIGADPIRRFLCIWPLMRVIGHGLNTWVSIKAGPVYVGHWCNQWGFVGWTLVQLPRVVFPTKAWPQWTEPPHPHHIGRLTGAMHAWEMGGLREQEGWRSGFIRPKENSSWKTSVDLNNWFVGKDSGAQRP